MWLDWCGKRNARIAKLQRCTAFLRLIIRYCQLFFDSLAEPSFCDDDIRFEHLNNSYGNLWWIKQCLGIPGCHVFQQTDMRKKGVHVCFVWICVEVCRQPWLRNGSLSAPRSHGSQVMRVVGVSILGGCGTFLSYQAVPGSWGASQLLLHGAGEVDWLLALIGVRNHGIL